MTANRGGPPPEGGGPGKQQQTDQPIEDIGHIGAYQASPAAKPIDDEIGDVGAYQASPAAHPRLEPPDPRDWVRAVTNFSFLGIFAVTIILSFCAAIWRGSDWTNVKDLLQLLLPAETALLGSAVGFYFGSQTNTPGKGK